MIMQLAELAVILCLGVVQADDSALMPPPVETKP